MSYEWCDKAEAIANPESERVKARALHDFVMETLTRLHLVEARLAALEAARTPAPASDGVTVEECVKAMEETLQHVDEIKNTFGSHAVIYVARATLRVAIQRAKGGE